MTIGLNSSQESTLSRNLTQCLLLGEDFTESARVASLCRAMSTFRLGGGAMRDDSIHVLKTIKYSAFAVSVVTLTGIVALMFLARGKTGDAGDIAGVVAPALLLACVSGVVAAVAAVSQKRAQR
jgi:hypothetical protein